MKKIVLVAVGLLMLTACTHKSGDAKISLNRKTMRLKI